MKNKSEIKRETKRSTLINSLPENRKEVPSIKYENNLNQSSDNPFKVLEHKMEDGFNQLLAIFDKYYKPKEVEEFPYIYSLKELAAFLNCSVVTCQKMKNNNSIPYMQDGRILIFEKAAVLEALKSNPIYKKAKIKR